MSETEAGAAHAERIKRQVAADRQRARQSPRRKYDLNTLADELTQVVDPLPVPTWYLDQLCRRMEAMIDEVHRDGVIHGWRPETENL